MLLNLKEVKTHLNVDSCFHEDDEYIKSLIEVAEDTVRTHLQVTSLDDIVLSNGGTLPASIKHAMLLLIGNWYANREGISFAQAHDIPYSYKYLLDPFKRFDDSQY